jgi:hypothetical protein
MKDTLFEIPVQLSPYKEWERKNRIKTHFNPDCEYPWCASRTVKTCAESFYNNGERFSAFGDSRDEAISNLCVKLNIPVYGSKQERSLHDPRN